MDAISNGLDSATTYDIIRATREVCTAIDVTLCLSLLQPPPEVFDLFDEVILMSEGEIIYHGKRSLLVVQLIMCASYFIFKKFQ
jgi:ABC-type multidrug transport system ATPase subunit